MSVEEIEKRITQARPAMPEGAKERLDRRLKAAREGRAGEKSRQRGSHRSWLSGPRAAFAGVAAVAALAVGAPLVAELSSPGLQSSSDAPQPTLVSPTDRAGVTSTPSAPSQSESEIPATTEAPDVLGAEPQPLPIPVERGVDPDQPRKVERSATLQLEAQDPRAVSEEAIAATRAFGGVVLSAQISDSSENASATLQLQVPTRSLDAAVSRLSDLAQVESVQTSQLDVTSSFDPLEESLQELQATRASLLRELKRAEGEVERSALAEEIRLNHEQAQGIRDQLDALETRTSYAQISVAITQPGEQVAAEDEEDFGPGEALEWWGEAAEDLAGVGVILAPFAILVGGGWILIRRRHRTKLGR